MELDKREYDELLSENALYRACLDNLLRALDGAPNAPKLEQATAAARQVLTVH